MTLHKYLLDSGRNRKEFAQAVKISPGYLNLLLYDRTRQPSIGLCLRIVKASGGKISLADLRKEFDGKSHDDFNCKNYAKAAF